MARDKKSMIGFDPLAWLDKENPDQGTENKAYDTNGEDKKSNNVTKKSSRKNKTNMIHILGHKIDEIALSKGYTLAESVIDEVVEHFYGELFDQYPEIKTLFTEADDKAQVEKLSSALGLLMSNIRNEPFLLTTLEDLGVRHQKYGALPEHYPIVVELLNSSFKSVIGRSWTKAISAAWVSLLGATAETMYSVYVDVSSLNKNEKKDVTQLEEADVHVGNVIELKGVQDISKSQVLKNDLIMLVNENDEFDIDGSIVERIDGSALQLLCALFIYAKENNVVINWINPSDALIRSAEVIGVNKILELS